MKQSHISKFNGTEFPQFGHALRENWQDINTTGFVQFPQIKIKDFQGSIWKDNKSL